ncbi:thioredoxin-disulfide reductase [Neglectibacter caecimuris]|jgi:thioredoxin reductase (NADPH)|uniref:thioredoxin-disulfide reductase n=1 Tax=Neglectibacter caecimuris TaxID=3093658 RepID=UPI002AC8C39F|nr:thioredoxin-disulfide reductase [Neglectibacter sp. M00184]
MEQTIFDTVILGGGPAGYTAALYAARANFSVLLLEKLAPGGQMATTDVIDNYPGFPEGIHGFDLAVKMKESAERFGVQTKLAEVVEAELTGEIKEIKTKKETFFARTVVLATGARPRELGLPGERELRGRGVSYCATCDGMFYRGKIAAVVGGGNTAAADALYLSRICEKVYLIHRRDTLRAQKAYLAPLEQAENVELIWNSRVEALLYQDTLTGLRVKHTVSGEEQELLCDGLFVAVGYLPETGLFQDQLELSEAGYVKADETTRTSLPGVYAVGDLREKPLRQVITAAADGAVAVHFMEEYLNR